MEKLNFDYSLKNISIPSQKEYLTELIHSTEKFYRNFQFKVWHFLNPSESAKKETYGFRTIKAPPRSPELEQLGIRLQNMIRDVEFRHFDNSFQTKLRKDKLELSQKTSVLVPADKTANNYLLNKEEYNELLNKDIRKTYRKAAINDIEETVKEQQKIVSNLELDDRVFANAERNAYVTLKDHKDHFEEDPKVRLINPTKPEIGKISKIILSRVVQEIREKTNLKSWKNTDSVINWFKNLSNKKDLNFISFDIVDFYPNITENVLKEALEWASTIVNISEQEKEIIMKAKKSLLFNAGQAFVKRTNKKFDVTQGSFDGAETSDLVGLYLLSKLQHLDLDLGLYRDDGLGVSSLRPRQTELAAQKVAKVFKLHGFSIKIEANHKIVNYLDITLNLETGLFKPYSKPNNTVHYVHKKSNHPPAVIKSLPQNINNRLNRISANEEIFNAAVPQYQDALKKSDYEHVLRFQQTAEDSAEKKKKKRKRKNREVCWFNPPYSNNVKSKIGSQFLKIISETFPKSSILYKIANRSKIKVSYRCMPNMKAVISRHNNKILHQNEAAAPPTCNCQNKAECPLPGRCTIQRVCYQADVERLDTGAVETYTGATMDSFKKRFYGHKSSLNNRDYQHSTTLSTYVWKLKDENIPYKITWNIIGRAAPYNTVTNKCRLCLLEKYLIMFKPKGATLNQNSEFFTSCRHKQAHLLGKVKFKK